MHIVYAFVFPKTSHYNSYDIKTHLFGLRIPSCSRYKNPILPLYIFRIEYEYHNIESMNHIYVHNMNKFILIQIDVFSFLYTTYSSTSIYGPYTSYIFALLIMSRPNLFRLSLS